MLAKTIVVLAFIDSSRYAEVSKKFDLSGYKVIVVCPKDELSNTINNFGNKALGFLGLTGELRPVRDIEKRVRELFRLGIKNIYVPYSKQSLKELKEFSVKPIRHINELFVLLFGK